MVVAILLFLNKKGLIPIMENKNKEFKIDPALAIFAEALGVTFDELANCFDSVQKEAEELQKKYEEKQREMRDREYTFKRSESRGHSCSHSCGGSCDSTNGCSHPKSTGTTSSCSEGANKKKTVTKDNAYFAEMLKKNRQRQEMEQHKKVVDNFVNEAISKLEYNVSHGRDYVDIAYYSADKKIINDVAERLKAMNFEVKPNDKGVFVKIRL